MKRTIARSLFSLAALLSLPTLAQAEVTVTDPWVRATVPGQQATGAFMVLQSTENAQLLGASSSLSTSSLWGSHACQAATLLMLRSRWCS